MLKNLSVHEWSWSVPARLTVNNVLRRPILLRWVVVCRWKQIVALFFSKGFLYNNVQTFFAAPYPVLPSWAFLWQELLLSCCVVLIITGILLKSSSLFRQFSGRLFFSPSSCPCCHTKYLHHNNSSSVLLSVVFSFDCRASNHLYPMLRSFPQQAFVYQSINVSDVFVQMDVILLYVHNVRRVLHSIILLIDQTSNTSITTVDISYSKKQKSSRWPN